MLSRHSLFLCCLLLLPGALYAQDFVWAPGLPVGSDIPPLEAVDQNGAGHTLATLAGDKGLVLLFNRSFDWCPYCKTQLAELKLAAPAFEALGFKVATLTYDPVATLRIVAEDLDIGFPLLHDEATTHVTAWGILNPQYEPGHFAYGIPLPGIAVIGSNGVLLAKFAEEDYRVRPDFSLVLEALADL